MPAVQAVTMQVDHASHHPGRFRPSWAVLARF
jgi:hypothetical protein